MACGHVILPDMASLRVRIALLVPLLSCNAPDASGPPASSAASGSPPGSEAPAEPAPPPPPANEYALRSAYPPAAHVAVDGFQTIARFDVDASKAYVADLNHVVAIDRTTGDATTVVSDLFSFNVYVAVDDANVYLSNDGSAHPAGLLRVSKAGGTPELLVASPQGEAAFGGLAAAGGYVYYVRGNVLGRVAAAGGEPVVLATIGRGIASIAATPDAVFAIDYDGDLYRVATAGGVEPVRLAAAAVDGFAQRVLATPDGVYWTSGPMMSPEAGTTFHFLPNSATSASSISGPQVHIDDFAVDDLGFFWADYAGAKIRAVATTSPTLDFDLVDADGAPSQIRADASGLAWTTADGSGAWRFHLLPRQK